MVNKEYLPKTKKWIDKINNMETKEPTSTGEVLDFKDFRKYSDTFIETGTGRLGGVYLAIDAGFREIKTVEACENYHNENIRDLTVKFPINERFDEHQEVHFSSQTTFIRLFFGMSQDRLEEMIKYLDKPAVYFVDAHVSGPASAGHEDYMEKGNDSAYAQDNVITSELKIILAHRKDHVILIDDQNGLNDEGKKYIAMILEANPNYEFHFYDEKRGDILYKDKCLVCIPKLPLENGDDLPNELFNDEQRKDLIERVNTIKNKI